MRRYSPTDIDKALFCGHNYYLGRIEKKHALSGVPRIRGIAVHESARVNYQHKLETGENLSLEDVRDAANNSVLVQAGRGLSVPLGQSRASLIQEAEDSADRLAKLYYNEIGSRTDPKLVEQKIEIQVNPEVVLVSILDVQDQKGYISDIKTTGRSKTQSEADRSLQLTMQWAAARALNGEDPKGVRLDVLVDTKKPQVQQLWSERSLDDFNSLVNIVNAVAAAEQAGIFLPAAPSTTWKCDPQYCEHFFDCKFVNPKRGR